MQAQALNPDWLDCYPSGTVAPLTVGEGTAPLTFEQTWTYPVGSSNNIGYYYTWPTPSKVRLTLTEVERLRDAAKDNDDLKAVLRKFTPHIEIEVDFP